MPPKPSSNWERHAQSFLLTLITAMAIWVVSTVNNTAKDLVTLQAYVARLQVDVAMLTNDFRASNDARVRQSDIDKAFLQRDTEIAEVKTRLSSLEGKKK